MALHRETEHAQQAQLEKLTALLKQMTSLCRSVLSAAEEGEMPTVGVYYDALSERVADSEHMLSLIS